jgi:hypothetical protein
MLLKVNIIWKQNIWISTKYYFNSHINKKGDCLRNTDTPYIIRCILISNTCRCQTPLQYIILLCHFSKLWNTDTPYITTCILVSNTYRCQTPTHTHMIWSLHWTMSLLEIMLDMSVSVFHTWLIQIHISLLTPKNRQQSRIYNIHVLINALIQGNNLKLQKNWNYITCIEINH